MATFRTSRCQDDEAVYKSGTGTKGDGPHIYTGVEPFFLTFFWF